MGKYKIIRGLQHKLYGYPYWKREHADKVVEQLRSQGMMASAVKEKYGSARGMYCIYVYTEE